MKTLNVILRVLTVLAVCFALAGCLRSSDSNDDDLVEEDSSEEVGGDDVADSGDTGDSSGDGGGGGTASGAPAAPVVTPAYDDWTLTFTWPAVADADFYRVFEDPDGVSGFTQIGSDLTANEYTNNISLTERNGARYVVAACNSEGCTDSSEVTVDGLDSGITPIVVSGDPAPGIGSGAVFSGEVGTQLRFDVNQADDATLPSSDATYNGFFNVLIDNTGQIIFGGILNQQSGSVTDQVDGLNNEVLLRSNAGTTSVIAREGDPARNGTEFPTLDAGNIYFTENIQGNRLFSSLSSDGNGAITFKPGSNTDAFKVADDSFYPAGSAFWTITGLGQKAQSLKAGETLLPGNLEPKNFGSLEFDSNQAEQLVFGLSLQNADGTALAGSEDTGIYVRNADGSYREVVREAGGSARDFIYNLNSARPLLTDNGEVFYYALRGVSGPANRGIYTDSLGNGDFTRISRSEQTLLLDDGSLFEVTGFIGGANSFDVGADDSVAFLVNSGTLDQEDALLVWTNDGTSATTEVFFQEGDPVRGLPDASGVELAVSLGSNTTRLAFSRQSWAAFRASDEADINNRKSLLLASSPSGYTRVIAREGQQFAVDGVNYGVVTEILDFKMAAPAEMIVSLRFDEDGISGLQPDGSFVGPDGKNGLFRAVLCSPSEPC
ncbi:hypothetical protein [Marinobacter sp. UBA2498]|uniref:hypothetical protein n=1 Tax=Marinobacter sp. UBA2498 TaxID=1946813 RepID=UPI000C3785CA|nr:hypothetical protein [Marinobacter sp. UBA2498]MAM51197.1 hypothetical protein [Marinobacter sp.]